MVGINEVFEELDEIEKQFDELWATYNPNENSTNLCILYYKLSTLGYSYVAKSFEITRREQDEFILMKFKNVATKFSWALTAISAFVAPEILLPGVIGSSFLSYKRQSDKVLSRDELMDNDERERFLELLTNFDSKCSNCVDTIADRFEYLDSDEALEEVKKNNPEDYNRRMASKLIVDFMYDGRMEIPDNIKSDVISIIQKEFETDETDFEALVNIMYQKALDLGDENYQTSERARKLARQRKSEFYQ